MAQKLLDRRVIAPPLLVTRTGDLASLLCTLVSLFRSSAHSCSCPQTLPATAEGIGLTAERMVVALQCKKCKGQNVLKWLVMQRALGRYRERQTNKASLTQTSLIRADRF